MTDKSQVAAALMNNDPESVLAAFGLDGALQITPLGTGLINHTWKVASPQSEYVLQRINEHVFRQPQAIAENLLLIGHWLRLHRPDYFLPLPVRSGNGSTIVEKEGWFRLMPFVAGSHTKDTLQSPGQAFEAARQFGRFTSTLEGFDATLLRQTIPSFHDLSFRYEQFREALECGDAERIGESRLVTERLESLSSIKDEFERIRLDQDFQLRVTHHDTKISNVLFDDAGKGICVIDLDTVMPGYFISDLGDMIRTYVCPVSEEEPDISKVSVRRDFYDALMEGYLGEMCLTEKEKSRAGYAGLFMTYMQALRFFTDHLNKDRYYGARYPGHNLSRTQNQLALLDCLLRL